MRGLYFARGSIILLQPLISERRRGSIEYGGRHACLPEFEMLTSRADRNVYPRFPLCSGAESENLKKVSSKAAVSISCGQRMLSCHYPNHDQLVIPTTHGAIVSNSIFGERACLSFGPVNVRGGRLVY